MHAVSILEMLKVRMGLEERIVCQCVVARPMFLTNH